MTIPKYKPRLLHNKIEGLIKRGYVKRIFKLDQVSLEMIELRLSERIYKVY